MICFVLPDSNSDSTGLLSDVHVYRTFMSGSGIETGVSSAAGRTTCTNGSVSIHLQELNHRYFNANKVDNHVTMLMWNSDWPATISSLRLVDIVIAKTRYSLRQLKHIRTSSPLLTYRIWHTGHTSRDVRNPAAKHGLLASRLNILWLPWKRVFARVHRKKKKPFLHVPGSSWLKQTDVILSAWQKHPEWPELTVIGRGRLLDRLLKVGTTGISRVRLPNNVKWVTKHLSTENLDAYMLAGDVHLCPSLTEGFGHYINEARSSGALVLTVDAPPMNELVSLDAGVLVPGIEQSVRHASDILSPKSINWEDRIDNETVIVKAHRTPVHILEKAVSDVMNLENEQKQLLKVAARKKFEEGRHFFFHKIKTLLEVLQTTNRSNLHLQQIEGNLDVE